MIEFTVPAKVFQAAQIFKAKQDIRYYLNGVFISKDAIVSTCGSAMFFWEGETDIKDDIIIQTKDRIPPKSEVIKFRIEKEENRNIGFCYDDQEILIGCIVVEVIDGKFPNWRRVAPEKAKSTEFVGINTEYLSKLQKAVKLVGNSRYLGARMVLHGPEKQILFDIHGPKYKSTVIIMPMRL